LGENADVAAQQGVADLQKGSNDILGRASPRARALLENEFAQRDAIATDGFLDHGFQEKVSAFDSSSQARIGKLTEDAADEPDEAKALALLDPVKQINKDRRSFFGKDAAWEEDEDRKVISGFYKSRALKLAVGPTGSASAAIEYATKNRQYLSDQDYNTILTAYSDNALDETATAIVDGAPQTSATTSTTDTGARKLDPIAMFKTFVAPHEGSAYVVDSNGAGVKYGVNAAFNPDVDVKGLTLDKAAKIFEDRYYNPSGAAGLPPALAAVHADTYWLNQKQAMRILKESGGDVDKYLDLRTQFLNNLVASDPAKYGKYATGWKNRTEELRQFAMRQGTDGSPLPIGPDTSLQSFRQSVMARTDIGLALKTKIIQRAEARRADARQEQAIIESDAAGTLAQSAAALGDGFTDVKQLPQDAWLKASDETRATYMKAAQTNKDNKPLSPAVAAQIGFLKTFKPESLADPGVLSKLSAQGVPQRVISELAQFGGQARGTIAGAKSDPVDRGTLEALAKDPFKSAGFDFWSTETNKKKNPAGFAAEEKDEAQRRVQLLNFLDTESRAWALNNPGKKADTKTIQGWIGMSLIRVGKQGSARPFGSLSDQEVANVYGQKNWTDAATKLRSAGIEPTPANVANYLRRFFARSHGLP
jgi:lysozyme family protein